MANKKRKAWIITGSVFLSLIFILGSFLLIWFFADNYDEFYREANKEFKIPALNEGFTPQGISYIETQNLFLLCGYMNDSSPSRVYLIEPNDGYIKKFVTLKNLDGTDYIGHCGGITIYNNSVWVGSEEKISRFLLSDLYSSNSGDKINIIDETALINRSSYCTVYNGYLWVGEFYRDGNYNSDDSHKLTTINGKTNKAFISAYKINENKEFGLESIIPEKILSVTSLVQGMCFTKSGKIVLSTSYGLANSKLYVYENAFELEHHDAYTYKDVEIPLWYLDNPIRTIDAPCMSEELVFANNKVYINFESACQKYKAFVRESLDYVYSISID